MDNKKPKQGGTNDIACFYECYGLLSILKVPQKTTNNFTMNFMKKYGKIECHKELHKSKNKKNHHKHHKKEWKWSKRNDSFECKKCKETCIELNERMNKK